MSPRGHVTLHHTDVACEQLQSLIGQPASVGWLPFAKPQTPLVECQPLSVNRILPPTTSARP